MAFIFRLICTIFFLSGCTFLIYHPDRYLHADPHAMGYEYKEFFVHSFDGTKLLAWDLKSKTSAENLILMFHGNAENMSSHFINLAWILEHQTDVLIFDYRGYGLSEGSPEPRGVMEDGLKFLQIAYDKFKSQKYKRFIIYGQSLGGSVALRALEEVDWRDEISLLVLDSTFRSPKDVALDKTFYTLGFLISGDYTAKKDLSHITMPTLVIHAKKDPVINHKFGVELYQKIPTKKKSLWQLEGKGHGDVFFIEKGRYRQEFLNFLKLGTTDFL